MNRCKWCDLKNPKYVEYHDKEWGVLRTDDSAGLMMNLTLIGSVDMTKRRSQSFALTVLLCEIS